MTGPTLAVDAGQTQVRAALYPGDSEGGPRVGVAPGVRRMDSAGVGPDTVAGAVLEAVGELGPLDGTPAAVGLGLSGFEIAAEPDLRRIADALRERLGPAPVAIATDGATSLLGALEGRPGASWPPAPAPWPWPGTARSGPRSTAPDRCWATPAAASPSAAPGSTWRCATTTAAAAPRRWPRPPRTRFGPLDQLPAGDQPRRSAHPRDRRLRARRGRAGRAGEPDATEILAGAAHELALSGCAALGPRVRPRRRRPRCRAPATCSGPVTR